MTKKPLIILTGPTAVGKSDLSISLCKAINGAVISADSMQVYRHMDIGSAKIMPEEMQGIDHYLIDCLEPSDEFSVATFQKMAKEAMEVIYSKGQIPVIVGGTGFYIQSVIYDITFEREEDESKSEIRLKWEKFAAEKGTHALHEELRKVDSASADAIHENNIKRVIRALEYFELNHSPISLHNQEERAKESTYNFAYFVLNDDRKVLYDRINLRVDKMVDAGLIDEVQKLKDMGYTRAHVSMQGLGYKEVLDYLDGTCTLAEAVYIIKRDTRHFAKRQLTWFKRERDVIWVDKNKFDRRDSDILEFMLHILKEKRISSVNESI